MLAAGHPSPSYSAARRSLCRWSVSLRPGGRSHRIGSAGRGEPAPGGSTSLSQALGLTAKGKERLNVA